MKIKFTAITILFILTAGALNAQTLNLRFSTYAYGWSRADSLLSDGTASSKTTYIRGYQNLLLQAAKDNWSLNTLFQTDEKITGENGDAFNYRFYNLYIRGSNLFNVLDLKLGRQLVFAGVGRGMMDGLYLKIKAGKNKQYQLAGFGGALTRSDYKIKDYPSIKDNYVAGAQFSFFGIKDLMIAASYVNRNRKPDSYITTRLDSAFNTDSVTIDLDSHAEQLVGFDFDYNYKLKHNFYGKAYYDITLRKFYRGELNARVELIKNLRFSAEYLYRQPLIRYNSIFWVFEHKARHEIGGGIDYTLNNGINIYGKVGGVIFSKSDNDTVNPNDKSYSLRIQAGFSHPSFGVAYTKYLGYSGESDGASGYLYHELVKSILSASVSLNYSRYRIGLDYPTADTLGKVNAFGALFGLTYRPNPHFSIDAQGQFITNRIYKSDFRFLFGVNYWLFKKW